MSDTPQTPAGDAPATEPTAIKAGLPQPPPVSEPSGYRPVSGFAIAGFMASCVFGLMVLVVAAVALFRGEPFFYPIWVMLLPASALIISLVARSQLKSAEGTRAGEGLATAGIWISLLTGLGYLVYDRVTGLAVTSQSNAFLMDEREDSGFFPHLVKGSTNLTDFYTAFLLSLPPTQRGSVKPWDHGSVLKLHENSSDGGPGPLANFRKNIFIRLITSAPPGEVKVEPLGVQSWEYENRSYAVKRIYRVTTPEAEVDFSILTMSSEGEQAGEARQWFVAVNRIGRPTDKQIKRTELGEALRVLRYTAREAAFRWQQKVNEGESFALSQIDKTEYKKLRLPAKDRAYIRAKLQDLFLSKEPGRIASLQFPGDDPLGLGEWQLHDGKVQINVIMKTKLDPQGSQLPLMLEGRVIMETTVPIDPKALPPTPADVNWAVYGIQITQATSPLSLPTAKKEGGGPLPPRGGPPR